MIFRSTCGKTNPMTMVRASRKKSRGRSRSRSRSTATTASSQERSKQDSGSEEKDVLTHSHSVHELQCDAEIKELRCSMLSWFDINKRDLPWRKIDTDDVNERAYAIWVSEIMLQQTQVSTVISYYNKWMKKWPTLQALAASHIEEVNETWSGLGYYSRGRRLFEGAQKVVNEMGGSIPKTAQELEKKLPGVGRYTAGAIASIAMGQVTGLVDGNVIRVLSRLRRIGANSSQAEVMDTFWCLANQLVDPHRPGDFNQSLMELGATVCTPKAPLCGQCPVKFACRAFAKAENDKRKSSLTLCQSIKTDGKPAVVDIECLVTDCKLCPPADQPWDSKLGVLNFPRKEKKSKVRKENFNVVIVSGIAREKQVERAVPSFLISQRPQKGLLAGLWEFPSWAVQESKEAIRDVVTRDLSIQDEHIQELKALGEVDHLFSHVHHTYKVWLLTVSGRPNTVLERTARLRRWVSEQQLIEAAISTGTRKVFKLYKNCQDKSKPGSKRKKLSGDDEMDKDLKRSQTSISDFFTRKAT